MANSIHHTAFIFRENAAFTAATFSLALVLFKHFDACFKRLHKLIYSVEASRSSCCCVAAPFYCTIFPSICLFVCLSACRTACLSALLVIY